VLGRRHLVNEKLLDRIRLLRADAKNLPFANATFSHVMSNSLIHHLANPKIALAEAYRVTKPGGLLFFRDLVRPKDRETLEHLVHLYAGDANEHQQQLLADSLAASLTVEEVVELVRDLDLSVSSVNMTSDRHWTWIARKK